MQETRGRLQWSWRTERSIRRRTARMHMLLCMPGMQGMSLDALADQDDEDPSCGIRVPSGARAGLVGRVLHTTTQLAAAGLSASGQNGWVPCNDRQDAEFARSTHDLLLPQKTECVAKSMIPIEPFPAPNPPCSEPLALSDGDVRFLPNPIPSQRICS